MSFNQIHRRRRQFAIGLLALWLAPLTHAALFVQDLRYSASDSLWGPDGSSFSFKADGSASVGIVDLFEYSIGVDSGTVSAGFDGALQATYDDALTAPGSTTINLDWIPDETRALGGLGGFTGARLNTNLGVYANVTALEIFDVLDADYSVDINRRERPDLPDTLSGTDNSSGVSASLDVLIAEAGAELQPSLTSTLDIFSLSGVLGYSRRGSGTVSTTPFTMTDSGINLDFDLPEAGFWDFMLMTDPVLNNLYSSTFGLDLVIFEEHFSISRFETVRNEKNLGTLVSFPGSAFALSFANSVDLGSFSIFVDEWVDNVAVPEPGSLSLLGLGLLSLAMTRRRRRDSVR